MLRSLYSRYAPCLLCAAFTWTGCGGDSSLPPGGNDPRLTGGSSSSTTGAAESCAQPGDVADDSTLKTVFEDHFAIGVALNTPVFSALDEPRAALAAKHFNRTTAENAMKWSAIEPTEGQFEFESADTFVEFAEAHEMQVHGHVLVWHQQTPAWVFQNASGGSIDRDGLLARVEAHMNALAERYGSRIKSWDVVNEAFDDSGALRETPWLEIIGSDYIEQVFAMADRIFPDSKLVYNDYSLYLPAKRDAAIAMAKALREAGVRIDAIGEQGHYNLTRPTTSELDAALTAFAAADLDTLVTELDVDVLPRDTTGADLDDTMEPDPAIDPYVACMPASVDEAIAARWSELFAVYMHHAESISSITFWGLDDSQSWLNNFPVRGRTNYPLLFNRLLQPKSAYAHVVGEAER